MPAIALVVVTVAVTLVVVLENQQPFELSWSPSCASLDVSAEDAGADCNGARFAGSAAASRNRPPSTGRRARGPDRLAVRPLERGAPKGCTAKKVQARYTYGYEKVDGEWQIINHHSSAMPE